MISSPLPPGTACGVITPPYPTQYVGITGKVSIPDTRFQAQASLSVTRLFDSYTN